MKKFIIKYNMPKINLLVAEQEKKVVEDVYLTRDNLLALGFKELPTFTIMGSLHYDLKRRRYLSVGYVGTPNEMLFIAETDENDDKKIIDLVCLHNYDYDGRMTLKKMKLLIDFFNQ